MMLTTAPLIAGVAEGAGGKISGRHRARDLGIRIGHMPTGPLNAITDVDGVEVGHSTLIDGHGALEVGKGPVRTGVTAIWPHRSITDEYLCCAMDAPNGNGEVSGILAANQLGILSSPICLTNTSSVGMVYEALQTLQPDDGLPPVTPVVGETWDGYLNDITGRHVHADHVHAALRDAKPGPVEEGAVGGGTGMVCYDYKGGIGTASRMIDTAHGPYVVGALVQSNHGVRELLRVDGVPVGALLEGRSEPGPGKEQNSIVMVVATDAPLFPHQLQRLARRATHGLAKTGSISGNSSGDFTIAFSTGNRIPRREFHEGSGYALKSIDQFQINPFLQAASEAVDEAIINSMFMADDMTGINDTLVPALPITETIELMMQHGRIAGAPGE